jgi:peroxiredoxin
MAKVTLNTSAPDFALKDFNGEMVRISNYRDKSNVLLVFNRGFM